MAHVGDKLGRNCLQKICVGGAHKLLFWGGINGIPGGFGEGKFGSRGIIVSEGLML